MNKTPIMTNEGYKINYAESKIDMQNSKSIFNNIEIKSDNVEINNNVKIEKLTYGIGEKAFLNIDKYNNYLADIKTTKVANIELIFSFDEINTSLSNYIQITCLHDANISIVFKSKTIDIGNLNSIVKVFAKENTNVNVDILNLMNNKSNCLNSIEGVMEENSNMSLNVVDLGGLNSLQNIYLETRGNNAKGKINGIYMGNNDEVKDLNYIANLYGKRSEIDIEVQGALSEVSKKNFKGTINFKRGCTHSNGRENENCIMLSKTAVSKSLPVLLCMEDDVNGAHSTSSGKIDDNQIYYLQTRGISKKEAEKMLVHAKFKVLLQNIRNEEKREEIEKIIDRRLG